MFLVTGEIAIQALILCAIMYFVARHEADYSFDKVFMVAAGISLGTMLLTVLLIGRLGPIGALVAVIPSFAFASYMLVKFCWVSVPKSLLITVLFIAVQFGMRLVVGMMTKKVVASVNKTDSLVEQRMKDTEEARQMMMESLQGAYHGGQPNTPAPEDIPAQLQAVIATQLTNAVVPTTPPPAAVNPQPAIPAAPEPPVAAEPPTAIPVPPEPAVAVEPVPAAAEAPQTPAEDWAGAEKALAVSGIVSKKDHGIAIVDGNLVEEGQVVTAHHNGKTFRWTIRKILPDRLDLEPMDVR